MVNTGSRLKPRANPRPALLHRVFMPMYSLNALTELLSDHFSPSASICRHAGLMLSDPKHVISVAVAAIALNPRSPHKTDGQPCQPAFQPIPLYATVATTSHAAD